MTIDLANKFLVGTKRNEICTLFPVPRVMSKKDALNLAVWLVAVADDTGGAQGGDFQSLLTAVVTVYDMTACIWTQQGDDENDTYETSCGEMHSITEGTPEENKFKFCCYCGKPLKQSLIPPYVDDDDETT